MTAGNMDDRKKKMDFDIDESTLPYVEMLADP